MVKVSQSFSQQACFHWKQWCLKPRWIMLTVFIVQKLVHDGDNFVNLRFDIVLRLYPLSQWCRLSCGILTWLLYWSTRILLLILLTAATFSKFYIELWQTFTRSNLVAQNWLLPATSALCLEKKLCGLSVKLNLLIPVFTHVRVVCFESND